jgi:MFS family permease
MSHRTWLFVLSCVALVTSAFTFIIRADVLQSVGREYGFEQGFNGSMEGAVFYGMSLSLLLGAFICDAIGMKRVMWLAFISHVVGTLGVVLAPVFPDKDASLYWLIAFSFIQGCGNGFTETGINPLVATLYPREKTHYLNILHAWWPGGLILGGILATLVGRGIFLGPGEPIVRGLEIDWRLSLAFVLVPAAVYGFMLMTAQFPKTERVASGVSNREMFMESFRPGFLLMAFCMLLTASTELGPQKWQESVMTSLASVSGTVVLVYTSAMMFVLRHFAGPIAHRISPIGLLLASSFLSAIGLYLLSTADSAATAFAYATIFGLGIAYFWPTMLGVTAERFPKGGAMTLCLMGTVGNAAIGFTIPQMGRIADVYSVAEVQRLQSQDRISAPEADLVLQRDKAGKAVGLDPKAMYWIGRRAGEVRPDPNMPAVPKEHAAAAMSEAEARTVFGVARESQQHGFSMAFRWVSVLPWILVVIFGGMWIYDWSRGGYKAVHLLTEEEERELLSGGAEGPIS